ncbi:stalk domain-containing protein [Paenibacillus piri]|nr:stalk domain-containing protein [Paenibacillus piri]
MNKFVLGLSCGLVLSICHVAYASDIGKAVFFPAKYSFNGQERRLPPNYSTFNIDGDTYVPTRFLAEQMGAVVDYEEASKKINVQFPSVLEVKAEAHSARENDKFELTLLADKSIYRQNEFMNIWAELRYKGDASFDLGYSGQFIGFYVEDEQGVRSELGRILAVKPVAVLPGDVFKRNFPLWLLQQYNLDRQHPGSGPYDTSLYPSALPAGTYKIGAEVRYIDAPAYTNKTILSTEIEITVQ